MLNISVSISLQKDMKMKNFWTIASLKWLGNRLEFYSTEGNPDELFAANDLFVESRPILFYCTQTEHNFNSFVHFKKNGMLIFQHTDYLLKGQLSVFPWKFLCSLSEGVLKIWAGLAGIFSHMTYNSHCIGFSFNFSIVLLSPLYQQRVLVIKHYEF